MGMAIGFGMDAIGATGLGLVIAGTAAGPALIDTGKIGNGAGFAPALSYLGRRATRSEVGMVLSGLLGIF